MTASTEKKPLYRSRVVMAHSDSVYAALCGRHFRRLGWDVHLCGTGLEARHLAGVVAPEVVILDINLRDESGWLTCNKLLADQPGRRVILVGRNLTEENHRFATFVGATALVPLEGGVEALAGVLHVDALPVAS